MPTISFEISDEKLKNCIDTFQDCLGIELTPDQFLDACKITEFDASGIWGDTCDRETFCDLFVTEILGAKSIPCYGDCLSAEETTNYWKDVLERASKLGYKISGV